MMFQTTEPVKPEDPSNPSIEELNQREGVADYFFQGDIQLSEEQLGNIERSLAETGSSRAKRQAARTASLWTNNIVYYYFDAALDTRKRTSVKAALNYIQSRTCLTFVENSTAPSRIRVFSGAGCFSGVGMWPQEQQLSIGNGCELIGTTAHEFAHALGIWHMQMRDDRDNFIKVDLTNVPMTAEDVINYNPYEYGSMMHYDAKSFSTSGNSLVPTDASYLRTIGSRTISFYDIKTINDHYKCHEKCGAGSAVCQNGGIPNPKNCSVCVCPAGYGGTLCNQRPGGCGMGLTATAAWQVKQFTFGNGAITTPRDTYMQCNHYIWAPAGKRIQVRVTNLNNAQCRNGCHLNSIELKTISNHKRVTNPRICCTEQLNQVRTSNYNPTPIISHNRLLTSTYTFHYRFVS
ncbi:astacin [Ancylostoma caninum]|uniref:Zinc metalloproteinase n=1 Tax=Ancylostoma caninum TaxID=29170 RepID=A0A368FGI6_ANCCA|nr:astacin [Ancylostoma caninum]